MSIIVFNAGSSSLKFKLFRQSDLSETGKGSCSEIGSEKSSFSLTLTNNNDDKISKACRLDTHRDALTLCLEELEASPHHQVGAIRYVGHRVVHGGSLREPVQVTTKTIQELDKLTELAPLHNHRAVVVMRASLEIMPDAVHYAYFDTIFHATLPKHIYTYPLPREAASKKLVRKWGFHGLSHEFVAQCAADHLKTSLDNLKLITLHLGNGSSACAIESGKSIDTSMGLTPLSGLPGGTRSGDIDPSAVFHLISEPSEPKGAAAAAGGGAELSKAEKVLNQESGLKGICGMTHVSDIFEKAPHDHDAQLAIDIFVNRIQNFIGSYFVGLSGAHAIVFAGGIGEHSAPLREQVVRKLGCIGCSIDHKKNADATDRLSEKGVVDISGRGSAVKILVIATNEELRIAQLMSKIIPSYEE